MQKNRHMSKIIDIFSLYFNNYKESFTGRVIGRSLGINHQTALNYLNQLVDKKIMLVEIQGRNKKYTLNFDSIICKIYLQIAESENSTFILKDFELRKIIEIIIPFVESLILFGSYAKGIEKKGSDLDLVGINVKNKNDLMKKLEIFHREINIEFVTWKQFREQKNSTLGIEIQKNHLIFGNVYKVVDIYCS